MEQVKKLFEKTALFLAPMEGVTNPIFRQLICDNGSVDVVATEFVRLTGIKQKVKPFRRHDGVPLQIQVMGTTPEIVGGCIRYMKERGVLRDDDWLDLNVGCPSRRVNSRGAGAALLLDPPALLSILATMRENHPGPLSMKTRVGYQDDLDFSSLLSMLADSPIDFLTLHARTRCAGYVEPANNAYLTQAVSVLPFPVVGNGDVWTAADAVRMRDETGVAGVMCGRGVMRNPFLFCEIETALKGEVDQKTEEVRLEQLFHFVRSLLSEYQRKEPRPDAWVGRAKEFLTWFSRHELTGKELFSVAKRLRTLGEIRDAIEEFYVSLTGAGLECCPDTSRALRMSA